jgi:SNF2 family DNA or RNA helicase
MNLLDKVNVGGKTLHPHQVAAVHWMMEREADNNVCGGFLCDEMGLGKTITMMGLLLASRVRQTLILGPLAVLHQWSQVAKSAGFAVFSLDAATKSWIHTGGNILKGSVFLANYDKLHKNYAEPFAKTFQRIVFDEAHTLRNGESAKRKFAKLLIGQRKWFLTGTPIVNGIDDFTSLIKLLNPSYTPTSLKDAKRLMRRYALCRRVEQVREQFPKLFPTDPVVKRHELDFATSAEETFYRSIQGIQANELQNLLAADRLDLGGFMTLLLRLRQISVHPQTYINAKRREQGEAYTRPDWIGDSTKTEKILQILKEEKNPKGFVIFCNFHDEMELLKQRIEAEHCVEKVLLYHGGMSVAQRQTTLQELEAAKTKTDTSFVYEICKQPTLRQFPVDLLRHISGYVGSRHVVLLAQIHSAGTGLNLQFMDRVIFNTPWWTAALMDQAAGRVLRLGQKKDVIIHHLLLKEEMEMSLNIDRFMNTKVEEKRQICTTLLDAAQHVL